MTLLHTLILAGLVATNVVANQESIEKSLMAPCCWTATIADHNSEVAMEMKQNIRRMLNEGKDDTEILTFYEKKYGERILAQPKAVGFNILAWTIPMIFFFIGSWTVSLFLGRKVQDRATPLISKQTSVEDEKYLRRINQELYES